MRKVIQILVGVGALGALSPFAPSWAGGEAAAKSPKASNQATGQHQSALSIQNRDDQLTLRTEPAVDLKALGIDPAPFKEVTNDTSLIQILASNRPNQIGTVKQVGEGRMELELGDGRRFAATQIREERSRARDGTIALSAITTPGGFPIRNTDAKEGGIVATGNPSEVWIIDPDGKAERLSPPHVHAFHPILSPDARYVAFTAQLLVSGALQSKVLMIKDRMTGELSSFAERKHGADYEIAPVDWVEDGKVLRAIEDWGETGGHMKLKQVRVN